MDSKFGSSEIENNNSDEINYYNDESKISMEYMFGLKHSDNSRINYNKKIK